MTHVAATKERPILFSGPMVRAILDGKKTQTRRLLKAKRATPEEARADGSMPNFEAGCPCDPDGDGKRSEWRPSIFMPRWASRITLEVSSAHIERLWSISALSATAEGIDEQTPQDTIASFARLWDEINGNRAPWESNPWVWVVSFRRLSGGAP